MALAAGCEDPYAAGIAHPPGRPGVSPTPAFAYATPSPAVPVQTGTPTAGPTAEPIVATAIPAPSATPPPPATPTPTASATPVASPPSPAGTPTPAPTATKPGPGTTSPGPTPEPRLHGDPSTPSLLDTSRIVSLYGVPGVPAMGVLGASTPEAAATKAEQLAAEYTALDPGRPAIPAFHLIVAVAQAFPGPDGTYLARLKPAQIQPYIDVAREHHMLLFLDVQVGWSDPLTEVEKLEPYLEQPFVHVALDPEFATRSKDAAPGQAIGVITGAQVNAVQAYLSQLVRARQLPPKILIVHQFLERMLSGADQIGRYPGVSLVIDMDGFGSPALKLFKYDRYALAPYAEYPGMKLFYEWDQPLMTARAVVDLPDPPRIVIYQ